MKLSRRVFVWEQVDAFLTAIINLHIMHLSVFLSRYRYIEFCSNVCLLYFVFLQTEVYPHVLLRRL